MNNATQAAGGLDPQMQAQIKAQMADIIEPAAISYWPIAWGWWLLIACAIGLITVMIIAAIKHHRNNRYRTLALNALQDISNKAQQNAQQQAQQLMQLSKQVALHAYPHHRHTIVKAHGDEWLQWLNTTTATPLFTHKDAQQWQCALYAPASIQTSSNPALIALLQQWVKRHYSASALNKANKENINSSRKMEEQHV